VAGGMKDVRSLEIGYGKGPLQGTGDGHVALDYSFIALRLYIDPQYLRARAMAARLPFRDGSFSFVFTVAALEHVPDADVSPRCIEMLKPGGVAYVSPACHAAQYNCEGIPVRPYVDFTLRQRLVRLSLPIRTKSWVKALNTLPGRAARRTSSRLRRGPTNLHFKRLRPLRPDYERFWISDSDAVFRLNSHEGCLFPFWGMRGFESSFWENAAVVVRKLTGPEATTAHK
jgi:Methyltransferase domain